MQISDQVLHVAKEKNWPALKCAAIVGIAVDTILWSSVETRTAAISPRKTGMIWRAGSIFVWSVTSNAFFSEGSFASDTSFEISWEFWLRSAVPEAVASTSAMGGESRDSGAATAAGEIGLSIIIRRPRGDKVWKGGRAWKSLLTCCRPLYCKPLALWSTRRRRKDGSLVAVPYRTERHFAISLTWVTFPGRGVRLTSSATENDEHFTEKSMINMLTLDSVSAIRCLRNQAF